MDSGIHVMVWIGIGVATAVAAAVTFTDKLRALRRREAISNFRT